MKQHKWQPLNDDEISEILDKHGFNEVEIAGEYINIVGLIRDIEKAHGIKPQPKEPQYLYVYKNRESTEVVMLWSDKFEGNLLRYIGKIKLEVEDE